MRTRFTILGCGSSGGVPRVGNVWGNCDPANPKNRRRRCALLVERFGKQGCTTVLVDTPPDLREQLLAARVEHIDGALFTHAHADHAHGIDDLRGMFFITKRRIPVYADANTRAILETRFDYCFSQKPGSIYPAILRAHDIRPPEPIRIDGAGGPIEVVPILQEHGDAPALGFRFGAVAYSPDISGVPEASVPLLQGLDVWISSRTGSADTVSAVKTDSGKSRSAEARSVNAGTTRPYRGEHHPIPSRSPLKVPSDDAVEAIVACPSCRASRTDDFSALPSDHAGSICQ